MQNALPNDDAIVAFGVANQAPVFTGQTTYTNSQLGNHAPNTASVGDVSVGITSTGTVYLAYADGGNVNVLTLLGSNWYPTSNSSFSSSGHVDLSMSPADEPYVSFVQGSDSDLTVQKWVNNTWQDVGSASLSGINTVTSKLAFGPDGTPYLAYADQGSGALTVLRYDTANAVWQPVGTPSLGTLGMGGYDLTIGQSGTPYLTYSDRASNDALDVKAFENGVWTSLGAPAPQPFAVSGPQLVEDKDGAVYLSYRDVDRHLVVARFDGAQWDVSPTNALPVALSSPIELLVGADGNIQLAALGGGGYPAPLNVLSFDGTHWKQVGEPILTVGGNAMVTSADGSIFVTSMDPENQGKVEVQEFSTALAVTGTTTGTTLGGFDFTDAENDPLSFSITGGTDAALFVIRGGEVRFERAPAVGVYNVQVTVSDGFNDITKTVVVAVTAPDVNHAPVLDVSASPALANVAVGSGVPSGAVGSLVSTLVAGGSDADGNALGIALTGQAAGTTVYYSLNHGSTWTAAGALSESGALLLGPDARVYVSADAAGAVTDALSFKLWDLTRGVIGDTNVDTRTEPVIAKFTTGAVNAQDLVLSGSVAFIVDPQNSATGLVIVDVSDPAHPVKLSEMSFVEAYEVAVQGDYAYVAMKDGLAIVDIKDLANPTLVHTVPSARASGVLVDGDLAYVTGISGGLRIFDISTPTAPITLGTAMLGGDPLHESVLRDGLLYVADRNSGLHIFDVTDPQDPVWLGEAQTSNHWAIDVVLKGTVAYTAATNLGVAIINVADPANPVVQGYLREGTENAASVAQDGNLLYVGISGQGVRVYDISNAAAPVPVRFIDTQGYAGTSVIEGGKLFAAASNRLTVVDLDSDSAFSASTDTISQTVTPNAAPVFGHVQYQQTLLDPGLQEISYTQTPLVKGADGSLYLGYFGDSGVVTLHQQGDVWQTIPYAAFADGREMQMTTDAQGVPYLLFMQDTNKEINGNVELVSVVTVLSLQNGQWQPVGGNWLDIDYPQAPQLYIGADNKPYLTYTDNNTGELRLQHFVNGQWEALGQAGVPGLSGNQYAFIVGADDTPYISFANQNDNNRLQVMRFDGSDWVVVPNPQRADVAVYQSGIALDGNGFYVAYADGSSELFVEHFDGTDWTMLPLPRTVGTLGSSPLAYDLKVGGDGALYMLTSPHVMRSDFYVLRYADGAWTIISDLIDGARNTSLVLGDDGQVYVSSRNDETGGAIVYEIDPVAQATAVTTGTAVALHTSDPDGDALVYSITGGADKALFSVTPNGIQFKEKPTAAGTYSVQVTVDDGVNHVTRLVSVTVTVPPNSAPVLDADASPKLPDAELGGLEPHGAVGVKVSDLLGNSVSDVDDDAVGMVITGVHGGTLHYSLDDGETWTEVTDLISAGHALALSANTRIYFEAASGSTGTIDDALSFRAWDASDRKTGSWFDLSGKAEILVTANGAGAEHVAAFGDLVFENTGNGLVVYDPTQPDTVLGTLPQNVSNVVGVAAGDAFAYAVSRDGTLYVVSLDTPDSPAVAFTLDLADYMLQPSGVAAYGNTVLVASGDAGVSVFTVDQNGMPTVVGDRIPASTPTSLAIDGTRFVVGNGSLGVMVVDRSDNTFTSIDLAPLFVDATGVSARDVVIQGDYAFVASGRGGLVIANIADPSAPTWAAQLSLPGQSERLAVIGDRVFVITSSSVQVIDISDIANPTVGTPIAIDHATDIAVVGDQLMITTGDAKHLVSSGVIPGSVSKASDTVSVDIRDTIAPTLTLPTDHDAQLRGDDLSIASSEAGTVYLVKAGAHVGTPTASELTALVSDGKAVAMVVSNGHAVFDTDALLGGYVVYGVDVAGNVSSGSGNTISIRTVPALTIADDAVSFAEGDTPVAVAPGLLLSDDDAADAGLLLAYVRLVADSPILIGGAPIGSVEASESLVLVANPATMGGLTGEYSADEGVLTITGSGTLAQWQAALRAVQYSNTSQNPLAGRAVEITVVDTDEESFAQKTVVVEIAAVNNAPVITGVPQAAQVVTVGSAAELVVITVSDADSTMLTITLTPTNGKLYGVGVNLQGIATYTGTAQAINTYLSHAMFGLETAGTGSIEISVSDGVSATPTLMTYHFASAVVTPPTTPPVVPTTPVDGVPVEVSTGADGQQQIKIPVVTNDRDEDSSTPNSKLADITLVKTVSGTPLLNLGVPVGTGATANGPATPVSGATAQTVLDGRITAASGTTEQKAAAQSFVSSLEPGTQVVVQTVTVTAQAANGGPLVINAGNLQDGHKTALIIDTRALPAGTLIDLENVDFAIIVGDARVTGGAGANVVYGDDLNQFIVLGEGDDVLHGQGGNDTVGSLRGNDQTFGDDGDDVVYGGTGDDILHGGNGNDRMNGGFGFDTGVQSGVLADYTVTLDGYAVVLTHKVSGEVDRFLDVEHITFDSGTSIIVAHEAGDVAALTARFAGAQLIELNADRAVTGTEANDEVTPQLGIALNIDLGDGIDIVRLAGGREDVHIDVEAGQRAELTRLEDGAMLAFNQVELLAFANGDVTVLAHNHEEAVVGRAYELLLGRNVDTEGYAFWIEGIENGASLHATLTAMMQSPEYTGASVSNSAFLDLLYTTGFDRTADAAGKAFWLAALDSGVSRAQVLEGFAASSEAVVVIGSTIDVTVVS